jgi:hypothetical protein
MIAERRAVVTRPTLLNTSNLLVGLPMSIENDTTSVEYREIPEVPGYEFGSDGTMWSRWRRGLNREELGDDWHQVKGWLHKSGHRNVRVKINGKPTMFSLHVLVATTFHGPCPEGLECCHKNGIPSDNRADNLRWGTRKENIQDQFDHGCFAIGERSGASKLTEDQVREIRRLKATGMTLRALAAMFNVNSNRTIQCIVTRKTWAHVE